jgi:hypothetical protein
MPDEDIVSVFPIDEADRCVFSWPSSLSELLRDTALSPLYAGPPPAPARPSRPSNWTPFPLTLVRRCRVCASSRSVLCPTIFWCYRYLSLSLSPSCDPGPGPDPPADVSLGFRSRASGRAHYRRGMSARRWLGRRRGVDTISNMCQMQDARTRRLGRTFLRYYTFCINVTLTDWPGVGRPMPFAANADHVLPYQHPRL